MRVGQYWVVKLSTSTYKKGSGVVTSTTEKAYVDFGKEVTSKELRERMSGNIYYDWGYMEVSVREAFEEFKDYYDYLVKNEIWHIPNWLERIESNKEFIRINGIPKPTK